MQLTGQQAKAVATAIDRKRVYVALVDAGLHSTAERINKEPDALSLAEARGLIAELSGHDIDNSVALLALQRDLAKEALRLNQNHAPLPPCPGCKKQGTMTFSDDGNRPGWTCESCGTGPLYIGQ